MPEKNRPEVTRVFIDAHAWQTVGSSTRMQRRRKRKNESLWRVKDAEQDATNERAIPASDSVSWAIRRDRTNACFIYFPFLFILNK